MKLTKLLIKLKKLFKVSEKINMEHDKFEQKEICITNKDRILLNDVLVFNSTLQLNNFSIKVYNNIEAMEKSTQLNFH